MGTITSLLNGYKMYAACLVGILAILVNHFIAPIPGIDVDQGNWLDQVWTLIMIMTGRSALTKLEPPSVEPSKS